MVCRQDAPHRYAAKTTVAPTECLLLCLLAPSSLHSKKMRIGSSEKGNEMCIPSFKHTRRACFVERMTRTWGNETRISLMAILS